MDLGESTASRGDLRETVESALGGLEGLVPTFMPVSWVPVVEFGLFVLVLLVRPSGLLGAK